MRIKMKHSGSGDNIVNGSVVGGDMVINGDHVVIDGRVFRGKNISIDNGKVTVDGKEQEGSLVGHIAIEVNGDVEKIETESGEVTVIGNAGSINTMSGDVTCGDVAGDIKTMSGDIRSAAIAGSVETMSGNISQLKGKY